MTLDERVDAFLRAALTQPGGDHREGSLDLARALLEGEPTIATSTIHAAAASGEVQAVEAFLARDPALARSPGGPWQWDPLLCLCFSRFLRLDPARAPRMRETAALLLRHGADPNTHWIEPTDRPGTRESALYGAAGVANDVEIARLLLEAGADPNDGETPYHAAEHDGVPCAELLFRHGLDELGRSVMLRHKIDYEDLAGVRRLLELGANPNLTAPWGKSALHQAVWRDRPAEWFELLLAHGADPDIADCSGKTAFALAARTGRRKTAELLRTRGADTTLSDDDALVAACATGDAEALARILTTRPGAIAKLPESDRAVLVEVAAAGNTAGVRTMLDAGFDVNVRGPVWHETPAHRAALAGHLETMRVLVAFGADLTARDRSYDSSPLGWAAHGGHPDVLAHLLADPSRIDLRDAVEFGCLERVQQLLADADPNAALGAGEPGMLLRTAAAGGHLELVRWLLGRGADPRLANAEGLRAVDYAGQQGHATIVALLESYEPPRSDAWRRTDDNH